MENYNRKTFWIRVSLFYQIKMILILSLQNFFNDQQILNSRYMQKDVGTKMSPIDNHYKFQFWLHVYLNKKT